jgi:hypothetical protein
MRRATTVALLLVGIVVGVVTLAGCGSDGGSSGDPGTSGTTAGADGTVSSDGAPSIDVCEIVTAEDAAELFDAPATREDPAGSEALVAGVCIYGGAEDELTTRNLLQLRVYDGEQFFGEAIFPDAEDLDIGDESFVAVNEAAHTVDVQFVQDGKTGTVNYNTGSGIDVAARRDEVVAIAQQLADGI